MILRSIRKTRGLKLAAHRGHWNVARFLGRRASELASVLDSTVCEVKKRLYAARDLLKWSLATDMKRVVST